MQSTINSELSGAEPSSGVPFSTLIGGLALAIAAFLGLGGLEDEAQPALTAARPPAEPNVSSGAAPGRLLVYLVATEAEKRALHEDVGTSPWFIGESQAGTGTEVRIIALDEKQEESLEVLARLLPEASLASGSGPAIKLVDMR